MTEGVWRARSKKVIAAVIKANPDLPEKELRKVLSRAYPFGQRKYWPYKVWLATINEHFEGRPAKPVEVSDDQLSLL